jgi:hypothetical protein
VPPEPPGVPAEPAAAQPGVPAEPAAAQPAASAEPVWPPAESSVPAQPVWPPAEPALPGEPGAAAAKPRRPWGLLALVAVVALLVGIGGTSAAFLLYDRFNVPEYTFNVSVFLKADVTDADRDAVRSALAGIDTLDGVEYESREQAYENFKEIYRDSPDLIESVRPDTLPESFRFQTKGTDFDCRILAPALALPAVDDVYVAGISKENKELPVKDVYCG